MKINQEWASHKCVVKEMSQDEVGDDRNWSYFQEAQGRVGGQLINAQDMLMQQKHKDQ